MKKKKKNRTQNGEKSRVTSAKNVFFEKHSKETSVSKLVTSLHGKTKIFIKRTKTITK